MLRPVVSFTAGKVPTKNPFSEVAEMLERHAARDIPGSHKGRRMPLGGTTSPGGDPAFVRGVELVLGPETDAFLRDAEKASK